MLRRIKYWLSHLALYMYSADMVQHRKLDVLLHYAGYSCNVFLLVALGLGLYNRWNHTHDMFIVLIGLLALFVFGISCALVYYFSMQGIGYSLMRLWIGCLLGVIAFTEQPQMEGDAVEETMDFLLVVSLCIRCVWAVLERVRQFTSYSSVVNPMEWLEMLGMCVAAVACGRDLGSISLAILGLALTLAAIRLKSYLALLHLVCMVSIVSTVFFPQLLNVTANPFALLCFLGRMALDPILDLYFCKLSTVERWTPLLQTSFLIQKLFIMCVTAMEVMFLALHARQMPRHKEWYVVVPIFTAFAMVWLCYHMVFIVTCWQLSSKLTDCVTTYRGMTAESRSLPGIMAAKGVRHFSLICQRLVLVAMLLTILLTAVGWQTKTSLSLAVVFVVLPIEIAAISLLWELGSTLGGTCIGYALVAPVFQQQLGETATTTVLPTSAMQEMSGRATQTLNAIQRFFSHHLVDTFGCDFSSCGLSMESVQSKLKSFFQQNMQDGPRYDTYLVYYSGQVYENGHWALAGSESLHLESILEWWQDCNQSSGARLIFILDTKHSNPWLREVRRIPQDYVAVQTCILTAVSDPETGNKATVGDFTAQWVDYNCDALSAVDWQERERRLLAVYSVSRNWTDFTFHLPTEQDMEQHWDANFPKLTKPLIKATNFPKCGDIFCCCDCVVRCLRKKKMSWLPPHNLNTGHGFRLVRS